MPCRENMITEVITVRPEQTVAEALAILDKNSIRTLPVVNEENHILGLFSFSNLLQSILPVAVTLTEDLRHFKNLNISLDFLHGEAPWVAKRLKTYLPKTMKEVMVTDIHTVHPETPLREGVRLLVEYGSPIPVVNDDKMVVGLISSQSAIKALMSIMMSTLDKGEEIDE